MKVLIINGSSRENGNTEKLAKIAVDGVEHSFIHLRDLDIHPIIDQRHEPDGFEPVDDDYDSTIRFVLEHDVIVFATPLYWYGMSGLMKNFIDRWSQVLRDPSLNFKERMSKIPAYLIICGGPDSKIKGLPLVQQFKHIFDFMTMEFKGYVIGQGVKPGEVLKDEVGCLQAKNLLKKEASAPVK